MGGSLSRKKEKERRKISVMVVGAGGVGKSSITVQFVHNIYVAMYDPTIEEIFTKDLALEDSTEVTFEIFDTTAFSEDSPSLKSQAFKCDGFLIVYSVIAGSTFQAVKGVYEELQREREKKDPLIGVLVGNKIDYLSGSETSKRVVPREDAEKLAKELSLGYIETSARTKENIQELFEMIANQIIFDSPFFQFSIKGARKREGREEE